MNKLNIIMLVRQFSPYGGLELYTHKIVEGLLSHDFKITIVCQEYQSDIKDQNLTVQLINPKKAKSKATRLRNLAQASDEVLAKILAENKNIDIIHSQHCPNSFANVVTFHNHSINRLNEVGHEWEKALNTYKCLFNSAYKIRDKQDEILCRNASCLIFPSEIMASDFYNRFTFLKNNNNNKSYLIAPPGADLYGEKKLTNPEINSAGYSQNKENIFHFLFVGRGFRKKGLDILLSACQILKNKYKCKFKLLIAGLNEKPLDKFNLNLMGLQNHVSYLGFQKNMELVYEQAQAIILPSRIEPFGMAPIQAMQRGLVPIVSRVSGVAETLRDKLNSLILQNHLDPAELANLMYLLVEDKNLYQKLSDRAKTDSNSLSWDFTLEQTIQAYKIAHENLQKNKNKD